MYACYGINMEHLSFSSKLASCEEVVEVSLTQECEVDISIVYPPNTPDQEPTVTCSTACSASEIQVCVCLDSQETAFLCFCIFLSRDIPKSIAMYQKSWNPMPIYVSSYENILTYVYLHFITPDMVRGVAVPQGEQT